MKKQSFFLTFAIALTFCTYLVGTPMRVNAGPGITTGGSEDSSSSSGDNFNPGNAQPPVEPAPGVNVEFSGNGGLSVSTEVQNTLNVIITNIVSQNPEPNSPSAAIIAILQGGLNAEDSMKLLQRSLENLGVSKSSVQKLVSSLVSITGKQSASALGVPVGIKSLVANSAIAQNETSLNVDVNQLNIAINAYNQIVIESSPEVLQKLSKDPQFLEIGKLLKQLRTAMNKN